MRESTKSLPRQSAQCLSDLVLDALVSAQPQPAERMQHLAGCARCSGRLAMFREAEQLWSGTVEELLRGAKARTQLTEQPEARRFTWPWLGVAASACALAFMIVLVAQSERTTSSASKNPQVATRAQDQVFVEHAGIRAKGTALRFFRNRDGEVTQGRSGDSFRAGDALRFVVSTGDAAHFLLIGVEESGKVTAYHPFNARRSVLLTPGVDMPLPDSLVLDDSQDTEYFVGIFSPEAIEFEDLARLLAKDIRKHKDAESAIERLPYPGTRNVVTIKRER